MLGVILSNDRRGVGAVKADRVSQRLPKKARPCGPRRIPAI